MYGYSVLNFNLTRETQETVDLNSRSFLIFDFASHRGSDVIISFFYDDSLIQKSQRRLGEYITTQTFDLMAFDINPEKRFPDPSSFGFLF